MRLIVVASAIYLSIVGLCNAGQAQSEQLSPASDDNSATVSASAARSKPIRLAASVATTGDTSTATVTADSRTTQDNGQLAEIMVTATKRSESLSKAPLAVSVISQDELTGSGVVGIKDLASSVPSLDIGENALFNAVELTIRGISTAGDAEDSDPAVPLYIDGVYVPRSQGLTSTLYDLERVEIERGPQGTLDGRNSTAGGIKVITASPTDHFEAKTDVSFGNYSDILTHGMINIPLTDSFWIRGAFSTHQNTGYFNTLGSTDRNYGAANDYDGRLTALWKPSSSFSWRLSFDDFESRGTPGLGIDSNANGKPVDGQSVYERQVNASVQPNNHIENMGIRSRMDLDLTDQFSITYLAGYQSVTWGSTQNSNGTLDEILDATYRLNNTNTYQEIDVKYDIGSWKLIGGGTYFHEKTRGNAAYTLYNIDSNIDFFIPNTTSESYGGFLQAQYAVSDTLRLTAGARESVDDKSKLGKLEAFCPVDTSVVYGVTPPAGCGTPLDIGSSGHWSKATYKVGVDYDITPNNLTYATVSTGYKAGGLSDVPTGTIGQKYQPENVTNFELGLKSRLFDQTLAINTALFYMDYKDLQVSQVGNQGGILTTNAAKAKIYGIEIEPTWRVTTKDRLSGFVDFLHATYSTYSNAIDQLNLTPFASLAGNYLPRAPEFSARIKYEHDFDFEGGNILRPAISVFGQSKSYLREFNLPIDTVPSYSKTDLTLSFVPSVGHWSIQGFVYNIENNAVRTAPLTIAGHYYTYYGAPRTYGARVSFEY